jgi:hypothetical protein
MQEYQASLRRYETMVLARFFAKMLRNGKAGASVADGLVYFAALKCDPEVFFYPFLVELLNRVPAPFGRFVSSEMRARFAKLLKQKASDPEMAWPRQTKLFKATVRLLQFDESAMLGQRFLLLWEVLQRVNTLVEIFFPEQRQKTTAVTAGLIVASENEALIETLLFLDQVFFATPSISCLLEASLREKWCTLTQGLWLIVADDPRLTGQCTDVLFT